MSGPDTRQGRMIFRGAAGDFIVPPAWAGYLQMKYAEPVEPGPPPCQCINVQWGGDGTDFRERWYVGQMLAVNRGCGNGDTIWLDSADVTIEVWAYPSTVDGRDEGYDNQARYS